MSEPHLTLGRWRVRAQVGVVALLLGACGFDRPLAPSGLLPVIQGTLVAGADSQFFRLDWATSADSAWTGAPDPIPAGLVALTVTGPGGSQPLTLRPGGGAGIFVITLPVVAESTYVLSGTIDGAPISATTRVPAPLSVIAPAGDTLTITRSTMCTFLCTIPYQVASAGAGGFLFAVIGSPGVVLREARLDSGSGELVFQADTLVTTLRLTAMDPNLAAFFAAAGPHSSILGGFGLFGSATSADRIVRWQ